MLTCMDDVALGPKRGRSGTAAFLLVLVLAVGAVGYIGWQQVRPTRGEFPTVAADLSPRQAKILAVARAEWENPGAATKYSQGIEEEWCADFVSWVLRSAGYPMSNPNSGSWRIPGVLTLHAYLKKEGRFRPVNDGYTPRPGDIVIYNGGDFGQHTNLVIDTADGRIRTVGGNQFASVGNQSVTVKDTKLNDTGVVGYGTP